MSGSHQIISPPVPGDTNGLHGLCSPCSTLLQARALNLSTNQFNVKRQGCCSKNSIQKRKKPLPPVMDRLLHHTTLAILTSRPIAVLHMRGVDQS